MQQPQQNIEVTIKLGVDQALLALAYLENLSKNNETAAAGVARDPAVKATEAAVKAAEKAARKPRSDAGQPRGPNARTTGTETAGAQNAPSAAPSAPAAPAPSAQPNAGAATGTNTGSATAASPDPVAVPPAAGAAVLPADIAAPSFKLEDARNALQRYHDKFGVPAALTLLQRYGVKRISEVSAESYAKFIGEANAAVSTGTAVQ